MQNLHRLLYRMEKGRVLGDVVETGVAQGGTAILIASLVLEAGLERQVWLYDVFESSNFDGPQFEAVHETLFKTFRFDPERVHLVKGLFKTTLPKYPGRPIAFLHIDAGGYEPIKCCLENLYPHIQSGGWVVLDNYGWDKFVLATVAKCKLSHAYRSVAKNYYRKQCKAAAVFLYKQAIHYWPLDLRLYWNLLEAYLLNKDKDNMQDWQMPEPLPEIDL